MLGRHRRHIEDVYIAINSIHNPDFLLVGTYVDAVAHRTVRLTSRGIRQLREPRFRCVCLNTVEHLAAPLIAGPRRAHLKPEQPVYIRENILLVICNRERTDALAEWTD